MMPASTLGDELTTNFAFRVISPPSLCWLIAIGAQRYNKFQLSAFAYFAEDDISSALMIKASLFLGHIPASGDDNIISLPLRFFAILSFADDDSPFSCFSSMTSSGFFEQCRTPTAAHTLRRIHLFPTIAAISFFPGLITKFLSRRQRYSYTEASSSLIIDLYGMGNCCRRERIKSILISF